MPFAKGAMAVAEELFREQAFGRSDRVGAVDDDDIDAAGLGVLHPFDAVTERSGARIFVQLAQLRKIFFGQARDALVDLDLQRGLHVRDAAPRATCRNRRRR